MRLVLLLYLLTTNANTYVQLYTINQNQIYVTINTNIVDNIIPVAVAELCYNNQY